MAGGLAAPQNFPIRDPRDKKQRNGRIFNVIRYNPYAGMRGPSDWPTGDDAPKRVEKPTMVGKVKDDAQSSMGM